MKHSVMSEKIKLLIPIDVIMQFLINIIFEKSVPSHVMNLTGTYKNQTLQLKLFKSFKSTFIKEYYNLSNRNLTIQFSIIGLFSKAKTEYSKKIIT